MLMDELVLDHKIHCSKRRLRHLPKQFQQGVALPSG